MTSPLTAVSLVLLVVLAGCSSFGGQPTPVPEPTPAPPEATPTLTPTSTSTPDGGTDTGTDDPYADPESDPVGWEDGYWYDEPIGVDQSDGLTDAELAAYVGRAKARVEHLRGQEFAREVTVEVLTREEFAERERARSDENPEDPAYNRWNNQVWEALFIVDEETDISQAFDSLGESLILGQYFPGDDALLVVSDDPERPVVDNETLVHELVHAMQDQQYNLSAPRYGPPTQDAQLARNGLTEGEAEYVTALYVEKCASGEWECVETPASNAPSPDYSQLNLGVILVVIQPYGDGPAYVQSLVDEDGWNAVDDAHRDLPQSTERIMHRRADDAVPALVVPNTARSGWQRYDSDIGDGGADTAGEASIYVMFWYQGYRYGNEVVDRSTILPPDAGQYDTYNLTSTPSLGWGNDKIVPYKNGEQDGYVWVSTWDTDRDAREFHDAYLQVLDGHGAEQVADSTWVIEKGGFTDAFYVTRNGDTVVVVNGPTVADLDDISGYAR